MRLIFVHGWSVKNTNTYGELPQALSNAAAPYGLDLDIQHVYLGRYVSFHDEVTMDDICRAMDTALHDLPGNGGGNIIPFSCITHSTGGPVVRSWLDRFYGVDGLNNCPLKHLVMLAPANHGSSLAVLGQARVGRIKSWFQGVEPGQQVLDWLCLGSSGQWQLNERYLDYDYTQGSFFPFVLTGQGIDNKFYDLLNSYLVESGSDGVVRVAGANMNYRYTSLVQTTEVIIRKSPLTYSLVAESDVRVSNSVPLGIYKDYSHSGKKMGIMKSIKAGDIDSVIVRDILMCIQVNSFVEYQNRANELRQFSGAQQKDDSTYCMLIFNIRDDQGNQIGQDDYDLFLLAGNGYSPQQLPKGFFKDRQMNTKTGRLVYYLNADKMSEIKDGKFGLRIVARPSSGFSYYCAAEFRSDGATAQSVLAPNETTYVDIKLHRFVDKNVFRFDSATDGSKDFKKIKPSGEFLSEG
jgi:hypothetical protein